MTPRTIARRAGWPFTKRAEWHWRWMYADRGERLHRVTSFRASSRDATDGWATAACGRCGVYSMPGPISRIGRLRCALCCKRAGVERGNGAPYNSGVDG